MRRLKLSEVRETMFEIEDLARKDFDRAMQKEVMLFVAILRETADGNPQAALMARLVLAKNIHVYME